MTYHHVYNIDQSIKMKVLCVLDDFTYFLCAAYMCTAFYFFKPVFALFKPLYLSVRRKDVLSSLVSFSILSAKGYLWCERTVRVSSMGGQCGMMSQTTQAFKNSITDTEMNKSSFALEQKFVNLSIFFFLSVPGISF